MSSRKATGLRNKGNISFEIDVRHCFININTAEECRDSIKRFRVYAFLVLLGEGEALMCSSIASNYFTKIQNQNIDIYTSQINNSVSGVLLYISPLGELLHSCLLEPENWAEQLFMVTKNAPDFKIDYIEQIPSAYIKCFKQRELREENEELPNTIQQLKWPELNINGPEIDLQDSPPLNFAKVSSLLHPGVQGSIFFAEPEFKHSCELGDDYETPNFSCHKKKLLSDIKKRLTSLNLDSRGSIEQQNSFNLSTHEGWIDVKELEFKDAKCQNKFSRSNSIQEVLFKQLIA